MRTASGFFSLSRWALAFCFALGGATSLRAQDSSGSGDEPAVVEDVMTDLQQQPATPTKPDVPAGVKSDTGPVVDLSPPPAASSNAAEAPAAPATGIPGIVAQGDNTALPAVPDVPPTFEDRKTVVLRALDKVTARTQTFEVPVGQQFNFGALTIAVRACRARPPLEPADAAAFLQIVEQKPGESMTALFSGWMFASKPSLSALEHPVYDVWVIGCGADPLKPPATPLPTMTPPPATTGKAPAPQPPKLAAPAVNQPNKKVSP